ncbi:MAG TPA: hypothetical protein VH186_39205, partial [Chloroflexia bacterium]|nr:hypothetical protein [Chloroflexia bacterium]
AVKLTGRDLDILQMAGMDGLATLACLNEKFWPGQSGKKCRERLGQLVRAGWLERHYLDTVFSRGEPVFTLTHLGARELKKATGHQALFVGLPARGEIHQQLLAQRARLRLEKELGARGLVLVEWTGERALRSEAYRGRLSGRVDKKQAGGAGLNNTRTAPGEWGDAKAIFQDRTGGQSYSFNLEIDGQYWGRMLREKIEGLAESGHPVVWVTLPSRAGRIRAEIMRTGANNIQVMVLALKTCQYHRKSYHKQGKGRQMNEYRRRSVGN